MEIAMHPQMPLRTPETDEQAQASGSARQTGHDSGPTRPAWIARWGKRAGVIAFLFFFIKGLAWLAVPVALATWWAQ